jgi:hypothetical protein
MNATPPTPDPSALPAPEVKPPADLAARVAEARARLELRRLRLQERFLQRQERALGLGTRRAVEREQEAMAKLLEADGLPSATWGQPVDPRDSFPDQAYLAYPSSWVSLPSDRQHGREWPFWLNITQLGQFRQASRVLVRTNSQAKGVLRNLTNYIIGTGFKYAAQAKAKPKPGEKPGDALAQLLEAVQAVIDAFLGEPDPLNFMTPWSWREREAFRRTRRDGDCFLRLFFRRDGRTEVRFVGPELVADPAGATLEDGWSYGIKHRVWVDAQGQRCEDVECVEGYWVVQAADSSKGEFVPARNMVHVKNVDEDSDVKRGLPDFVYDTLDAFRRAAKLQRNLSEGAALRAAIAWIEEYEVATKAQVTDFSSDMADTQVMDPLTGRTVNAEYWAPGTIPRVPKGKKYVNAPTGGEGAASDQAVVQGDLRQGLSAFCAPEYFSADASNADYSSTKEAGAPFVKAGETDQTYFRGHFLRCVWRAVEWAVECGLLPPETLRLVTIQVEAPVILHKDPEQQAQTDNLLIHAGVKSPQTATMEWGYDPDVEAANLAEAKRQGLGAGGEGGGSLNRSVAAKKAWAARQGGAGGGAGGEEPPPEETPPVQEARLRETKDDEPPDLDAIADILGGLFGDEALALFDEDAASAGHVHESYIRVREGLVLLEWEAAQHPRGKGGRFIPKHSAEAVSAAKDAVKRVLKGEKTADSHRQLVEHLGILNTKQLHELRKEYGLKAAAGLKQQLVEKLADRLGRGRHEGPPKAEPQKEPAKGGEKQAPAPKPAGKTPAAKASQEDTIKSLKALYDSSVAVGDRVVATGDFQHLADFRAKVDALTDGLSEKEAKQVLNGLGPTAKMIPAKSWKENLKGHMRRRLDMYLRGAEGEIGDKKRKAEAPAGAFKAGMDAALAGIDSGEVHAGNFRQKAAELVADLPPDQLRAGLDAAGIAERPRSRKHAAELVARVLGQQVEAKTRAESVGKKPDAADQSRPETKDEPAPEAGDDGLFKPYREPKASDERLAHVGKQVLDAYAQMESDGHGPAGDKMVSLPELRKKLGVPRREFDDAVLQLWRDGKLQLDSVSDLSGLSAEDRKNTLRLPGNRESDVLGWASRGKKYGSPEGGHWTDQTHQVARSVPDAIGGYTNAGDLPEWQSHKPLIADVYSQMQKRGLTGGMSLDNFKARLLQAHKEGKVRLARNDLPQAVKDNGEGKGPHRVTRSEIADQNATYHTIDTNANVARK